MSSNAEWQLQDAKAHFSEVFDRAVKGEPQVVTRRGKDAVVVVSRREYEELRKPGESFVSFLMHSPLCGSELVVERDTEPARAPELDLE